MPDRQRLTPGQAEFFDHLPKQGVATKRATARARPSVGHQVFMNRRPPADRPSTTSRHAGPTEDHLTITHACPFQRGLSARLRPRHPSLLVTLGVAWP
jgi:hypothetical protein